MLNKADKEWIDTNVTLAILGAHKEQKDDCQDRFDDRYIKKNGKKKEEHEHDENEIVISLPQKIVTNPFIYIVLLFLAIGFIGIVVLTGVNPLG